MQQADSHAAILARFALAAVRAASETLIDEDNPGLGCVKSCARNRMRRYKSF
jgi:hypothetical protein